jgi:hypothetical protein
VPRAPLPVASVTRARVVSRTTSKGITPPSSLLRAHAPDHLPPPDLRVPYLYPAVFAGCGQPLLEGDPSRRCSASLSQDAWAQIPAGRRVHMPVSSPRRRPSPNPANGSASRIDPLRDFTAAGVSRSSPFLTFRPPGLFATQVSPTAAAPTPQGSRDFYARAKHAPLPGRASGMLAVRTRQLTAEDFHLLDLQPCRPLPGLSPARETPCWAHS